MTANPSASILTILLAANIAAAEIPSALRKALTLHATFDKGVDADFAVGDKRIYTASSYKDRQDARPGLHHPDIKLAPGEGQSGGALRFLKKNVKAVYYQADKNMAYSPKNWSGTISFWLSLDPQKDLEPGFCDPIQITDEAYNDGAIWVDFTKDEVPRHFRLGVFGELKTWNPSNLPPDKNPAFTQRLITVTRAPFRGGKWTHVAITYAGLNSAEGGVAKLYLDGQLQGVTEKIREPFEWDPARAAVRLGVNYVGLFDELSIFSRPLSDQEVRSLSVTAQRR